MTSFARSSRIGSLLLKVASPDIIKEALLPYGYAENYTPEMISKARERALENMSMPDPSGGFDTQTGKALKSNKVLGFDIHGKPTIDPSEVSGNYGFEKHYKETVEPQQRRIAEMAAKDGGTGNLDKLSPMQDAQFRRAQRSPNFDPKAIEEYGIPHWVSGKDERKFIDQHLASGGKLPESVLARHGIGPDGAAIPPPATFNAEQLARINAMPGTIPNAGPGGIPAGGPGATMDVPPPRRFDPNAATNAGGAPPPSLSSAETIAQPGRAIPANSNRMAPPSAGMNTIDRGFNEIHAREMTPGMNTIDAGWPSAGPKSNATMGVNSAELIPASAGPKSVDIPVDSMMAPSSKGPAFADTQRGGVPPTQRQGTMISAQGPLPSAPEKAPTVEMGGAGGGKKTMVQAQPGRASSGTMLSTGVEGGGIPATKPAETMPNTRAAATVSSPATQAAGPQTIAAGPKTQSGVPATQGPATQAATQRGAHATVAPHTEIPGSKSPATIAAGPLSSATGPATQGRIPATMHDPSLGGAGRSGTIGAGPMTINAGPLQAGPASTHGPEIKPQSVRSPASAPPANSVRPQAVPAAAAHIPAHPPASGVVQKVEQAAAHAAPAEAAVARKGLQRVAGALKGKGGLAAGALALAAGGTGAGFMAKRRAAQQAAQGGQIPPEQLAKVSSEAVLDELAKLGAVSEEQAGAALDRIERLQQTRPTAGQMGRYAGIGATAAPVISAVSNAVKGKALFDGKGGPGKGGKILGIARGVAGESLKGALGASAIPVLRHETDRRAEISTLKHFVDEQAKEAFQTSQYSGPLSYGGFKQVSAQAPQKNPDLSTVVQKTAGIPTTPAGVLARATAVAKTPGVAKGPSIASIAKPPGFGKPIAAAISPTRGV